MNSEPFTLIKGKFPILFCAPHAHIHYRPNLTSSRRDQEEFTGQIVRDLAENSYASAIFLDNYVDYDPNYTPLTLNPFQQKIEEYVEEEKIKAVVDIHGLSDSKNYDFAIYYPNRYVKSKELAHNVAQRIKGEQLLKGANVTILNLPQMAVDNSDNRAISSFVVTQLKVPAIQIEVAYYIRENELLKSAFIKALAGYVTTL